jgi:tyramine---L-glutamate ligase
MKILVYEHLTSGAFGAGSLPNHLASEGNAMLQALLSDLAECQGVQPVIFRDPRLGIPAHTHRCHYIRDRDEFRHRWHACLNEVDAVLPIAPESDGLLAEIQASVLRAGKRLLGCCPTATQVAASKTLTMKSLAAAGLTTVPTTWLREWQPDTFKAPALICKPDDGAGCSDILYFESAAALHSWKRNTPEKIWRNRIVQPYLRGIAASLCLLCADGKAQLVSGNYQHLQLEAGTLRVTQLTVNGVESQQHVTLQAIADIIVQALPGLWGFIGVDLLLGPNPPVVVEINPRLTASYVGLREVYAESPATWLLTLLSKGRVTGILPPNPGHKITVPVAAHVT